MYGVYAIGFIMMLMTMIYSAADDNNKRIDIESQVIARQMIIWHNTARTLCRTSTICNINGEVNRNTIRNNLPEMGRNSPQYLSGNIRSYSNGSTMITIFYPEYIGSSRIGSALSAELIWQSGDDKMAGIYDRTNQRIGKYTGGLMRISVPRNIGGLDIPDGMSILGLNLL